MTGTRRVRIESEYGDSETATAIASSLTPDNTAQMQTSVDGSTLVTTVERESTGSLQATVDDYVVNLQVAAQLTTTDGETSSRQDKHNI